MTDGFGRRAPSADPASGEPVEHLELAAPLVSHEGFVSALTERVKWLSDVRHASYVRVRRLDRPAATSLVVVSDLTQAPRLSDLLEVSRQAGKTPDIEVLVALMRQLLPAAALFARHNKTLAIGAIAPERLFVVPPARVVIADPMFGSALDRLELDRATAWRRFGVSSPPGSDRFVSSPRGDVMALGVVALSILLGRLLSDDEFPGKLSALVTLARERHGVEERPLSPELSRWLKRALQLDEAHAFDSPQAALIAFEDVLSLDKQYVTRTAGLEAWVRQFARSKPGTVKFDKSKPEQPAAAPPEETPAQAIVADPRPAWRRFMPRVAIGLGALALLQALLLAYYWSRPSSGPSEGEGELVVQSRPPAARVIIDGADRGATPLTVALPAGTHVMEVRFGTGEPRVIPISIRAGIQTAQYVELQEPTPTAAPKGRPPAGRGAPPR